MDGEAGEGLSRWDRDALEALRFNWGSAYLIGHGDERGWWAARRDRIGDLLTAPDPEKLLNEIAENYAMKPVSRELGAEEATLP